MRNSYKNHRQFLMLFALATALFLSSCGDSASTPPPVEKKSDSAKATTKKDTMSKDSLPPVDPTIKKRPDNGNTPSGAH